MTQLAPQNVLELMLAIVRLTADHRDRRRLMDDLLVLLRRVVPADVICVVVRGASDDEVDALVTDPPVTLPSHRYSDYYGSRLQPTRSMHVYGERELADFPVQAAFWRELGVRQALTMPLVAHDTVVGGLTFWSRTHDMYDSVDRTMVALLASSVALALDAYLAFERLERLRQQAADENAALLAEARQRHGMRSLIGDVPAFSAIKEQVQLVAPTGSTVLITGESGTGKEMVARAIHDSSERRDRPFVALNCAALPTSLAESELFGHEEGAFTGAGKRRKGRFEMAHGGTLFLDEIGELALETQAKLLRALQQREIERVGGTETLKLDVRIIAATNRDLAALVAEKRFREDLFYRLSVFPIALPPLRARVADIARLVEFFIARAAQRMHLPVRRLTGEGLARLEAYDWPGNVRELQNAIERAMIVSPGDTIDVDAVLPAKLVRARQPPAAAAAAAPAPASAAVADGTDGALRDTYLAALDECNWVIEGPTGAAARLAVHPNTLRYRLKRLGLVRPAR